LARYNTNGATDKSFDGDGKLSTRVTLKGALLKDMAIQSDGKIIAVGETFGEPDQRIVMVRYNSDSSVDAYFGDKGFVSNNPSSGNDTAASVFALPTGKILVAGYMPGAPIATQFLSNGQLDSSFGNNGQATVFNAGFGVNAAARMADGRIVMAGGAPGN